MSSRTSSIAEAISRFRESPPRSREEREKERSELTQVGSPLAMPSRFWWQQKQKRNQKEEEEGEEGLGQGSEPLPPPPVFQGFSPSAKEQEQDQDSDPVASLEHIRASLASTLGSSSHENEVETTGEEDQPSNLNLDATNAEKEEEEDPSERSHITRTTAPVHFIVDEEQQQILEPDPETKTVEEEEGANSESGGETEPVEAPSVAQEESKPVKDSQTAVVSDDSNLALQALASQHPKLFRALKSMDSQEEEEEEDGDSVAAVGSSGIDSVETLETIVAEPLDALEDVIDEHELLDESDGESSEEEEEEREESGVKIEASGSLASETPAMVEALHDALEDKPEDASSTNPLSSDFARKLSTAKEIVVPPLAPTQVGASLEGEATINEEGENRMPLALEDTVSGRQDEKQLVGEETKANLDRAMDELLSDEDDDGGEGDEIIQRVLSEIGEQAGVDIFNSDFATNLELQSMIRKQIESAQMLSSPARDEKLEDRIRSVLSTPEASSSKREEEEEEGGERESGDVDASGSLERTLENYNTYNKAATLIQNKYRHYKAVRFQKEVEEQKDREKQDEFQVFVSKCTGEIESLWSEVSGLLAMFPLICIQIYRDSLLMNNQKFHQHLQTKDVVKYLASILPIGVLGQSYMQALFQVDGYQAVSMENLHSKALEYLALGHVEPDPSWDPQRKHALDILQSDNSKHVFESLDLDGTNRFSLTRVACGFEIVFEEKTNELRTFCKQLIHYFACKNVGEISHADIVTAFKLLSGIIDPDAEEEEGCSKEGSGGNTGAKSSEDKGEEKEMTREMAMDAKIEQNLKIIEKLYEALADAEEKNGKNSGSDSGDSISEMIKAVEDLPDDDVEELNEEINRQMQQEDSLSDAEEGESSRLQTQNQNQSDAAAISKTTEEDVNVKPAAPMEAKLPAAEQESVKPEIEIERAATQDTSTQVIEGSLPSEPSTGTTWETSKLGGSGSPQQQQMGNKERMLNRAMDRIRLAKRIDHQMKVKDNLLLQIGDLCVDDLKSKLPDNCRLKKSLESKEHDSQFAKDAGIMKSADYFGGTKPNEIQQQSTPTPAPIPEGGAADAQGGFVDYTSLQSEEVRYDQNPITHAGVVNHNKLSDVSGRICRDLDNLLINYENRVSPNKRREAEREQFQQQKTASSHSADGMSRQEQSIRPEIEGRGYHSPPLYQSPYYGTASGQQAQQTFPRQQEAATTQQGNRPTFPLEAGGGASFGTSAPQQQYPSHPIEDRFQYISKSMFGVDTSAIFSMHKGWSNAFLPTSMGSMGFNPQSFSVPRPPANIENFEKDDLKRAYVNTWQQVQAVYHK